MNLEIHKGIMESFFGQDEDAILDKKKKNWVNPYFKCGHKRLAMVSIQCSK